MSLSYIDEDGNLRTHTDGGIIDGLEYEKMDRYYLFENSFLKRNVEGLKSLLKTKELLVKSQNELIRMLKE